MDPRIWEYQILETIALPSRMISTTQLKFMLTPVVHTGCTHYSTISFPQLNNPSTYSKKWKYCHRRTCFMGKWQAYTVEKEVSKFIAAFDRICAKSSLTPHCPHRARTLTEPNLNPSSKRTVKMLISFFYCKR